MGEAAVDLSRSQGRLLMVDDEPFLREAIATSLRFMGYEVTTAQGGDEALRLARAQRFDLILLDVTLPDTDGFEVLRRLRRDGSRVPVLFLTARDTAADRATGLALGGDYLTKPFGLAELADRIAAGLSRRDDPAPGPGQSAGAA
jgi:two-component system OmpR family response regulator